MTKIKYVKPAAEFIETEAEDVITTSLLEDTVKGVKADSSKAANYEDWFDASGGGKVILK